MKVITRLFFVLITALVLTACGNSQTQTKKYFRINTTEAVNAESVKADTLVVKRPTALSILGGRPMVATKEDNSLVQLSNHFWLESPKVLLQDILKTWAEKHWKQITYQVPQQQAHHILNTRILAFEKNQNQALVTLEFSLYNEDNQLLFTTRLSQQQELTGEGYKAFAKAIGQAIDTILNQLSEQLHHVIKSTD